MPSFDLEKRTSSSSARPWFCNCCCKKKDDSRYLYAFDFDHTIVNDNSDSAITDVIAHPIPDSIKNIFDGTNWTEFMDHIFRYIASEGGTIEVLTQKIKELGLTSGMETLLHKIADTVKKKPQSHFIIISDANDFFIKTRLENFTPPIVPTAILSNHATYSPDKSYLKIYPYEEQESCDLCPKNMCKGRALRKYVVENGPFTRIYYSGDGGNDVCPAQHLSENDIVFVRQGYTMSKILSKGVYKGVPIKIIAKIIFFEDAKTIEENMIF